MAIGKEEQCQSQETPQRKEHRRSVSVNVNDAVTQSITDDVGMSGCSPFK